MSRFLSSTKDDPGKGLTLSEVIQASIKHFHELNTSDEGKFPHDGIRMKDQPHRDTGVKEDELTKGVQPEMSIEFP